MEEQSFSVRDRRIKHEDPASDSTPPPVTETAAAPDAPSAEDAQGGDGPTAADDLGFSTSEVASDSAPGVDFTTFAFSLAQWAFIFMGLEPYPDGTEQELNLDGARQNIDILAMLEEKTRGNLSEDESAFVTQLLYTLRMSFVEVSKSHPSG